MTPKQPRSDALSERLKGKADVLLSYLAYQKRRCATLIKTYQAVEQQVHSEDLKQEARQMQYVCKGKLALIEGIFRLLATGHASEEEHGA